MASSYHPRVPRAILGDAARLVEAYVTLLTRVGVVRPRRRHVLDGVRPTCVARSAGLDPSLYVYGAFFLLDFTRAPTWPHLCSEITARKVSRLEEKIASEWADWHTPVMGGVDPLLDLTHFGEAMRATRHADECFLAIRDTGGYHPASRICPTCPLAQACRAQLQEWIGLDVATLRGLGRSAALRAIRKAIPTYPLATTVDR